MTARLFDEALRASDEQPSSPGLRTLDITISGLQKTWCRSRVQAARRSGSGETRGGQGAKSGSPSATLIQMQALTARRREHDGVS
ncbi:hypothetical protein [Streptomyces sp. NPDC102409]|uniref:hypothetical protein n=1 Tax=Streptomyces sp. NPDC102409 TaxID=3366172 RepID=UPI0038065FCD